MTDPNWQREVDELHQFFQALFLGEIDSVDRADVVFGSDFTFVGPDGSLATRAEVLAQLEAGRGHTSQLLIGIEGHRTIADSRTVIVGEYIEVHQFADGGNRRRTTVVFVVDPDAPNGVRWCHAHETWLPSSGQS